MEDTRNHSTSTFWHTGDDRHADPNANMEQQDANFVRWRIYGEEDNRSYCVGVGETDHAESVFSIQLDVDWYRSGDIIAPLYNNNRNYSIIIDSDPIPIASGWSYRYEVLDNEPIPPHYLGEGVAYVKQGQLYRPPRKKYKLRIV